MTYRLVVISTEPARQSHTQNTTSLTMHDSVYTNVKSYYSQLAKQHHSDEDGRVKVASAFGYSVEQLLDVPPSANLGLSCGNPTDVARINQVRH